MFSAPPAPSDAIIMTVHTIDALARLGEHELLYALMARPTCEAGGVIGIFSSHDGLVVDLQFAHVADI